MPKPTLRKLLARIKRAREVQPLVRAAVEKRLQELRAQRANAFPKAPPLSGQN